MRKKAIDLELQFNKRNPVILYIGSGLTNPGATYLKAFRESGFHLFHVGEGSQEYPLQALPQEVSVEENAYGRTHVRIRRLNLIQLLELLKVPFDAIFHVQDWTDFDDWEQSPIPYFYFCTEMAQPYVPRPAQFILCATNNIMKYVKEKYPGKKGYVYHPYSIPFNKGGKFVYPDTKRDISCSFAGELYKLGPIYQDRQDVIHYVKEKVKDAELHYLAPPNPEKPNAQRKVASGMGLLNADNYRSLLMSSKIGINVPTRGGFNFRDLEIPATGGMLLTHRTTDLDEMGFQDGVNCRYYDTKEEAVEILLNRDLDAENKRIAEQGWELIFKGRSWWRDSVDNRFKEIVPYNEHCDYLVIDLNAELTDKVIETFKSKLLEIPLVKPHFEHADFVYNKDCLEIQIPIQKEIPQENLEKILQAMGFVQYTTEGHTIAHRIKAISMIMNRYVGVNIPAQVELNIPK